MKTPRYRIAMYSPGMVGFGHIRRNASIAQALCCSPLKPDIVMIAEARRGGADLIARRAKVISRAIKTFDPDLFIVDHLPMGAARELVRTLTRLRRHGR